LSRKHFDELIPIENGTKKYTSVKAAAGLVRRGRAVIIDGKLRIVSSASEFRELSDNSEFEWHPKPSAGFTVLQAERVQRK